jgi:DEAD/DEAH box helicase domain-containing protein
MLHSFLSREPTMREVYYDIETQKSAAEVGGWQNTRLMRISVAVTWSEADGFRRWREDEAQQLISYLQAHDRVISFNGDGFDSKVLSLYGDISQIKRKSLDLATSLKRNLGHRIRLDAIAQPTLGKGKTANGLTALRWWKEGKVEMIADYCQQDVQVLVDLMKFARSNGYLRYLDLSGNERMVYIKP